MGTFFIKVLWNLHQLQRTQWLKTSEILKIQEKKLRELIRYAYENVEFYHRRFDDIGLKPYNVKTTQDLKRIPVTTRSDLQENIPGGMLARGVAVEKCRKHVSSGSTGIPVTVLGDVNTEAYRAGLFGRPFFENGLRWTDRMMRITSDPEHTEWYEHLGLMRKMNVSPTKPVDSALDRFSVFRPDAIFGHTSYIYLIAKALSENSRLMKKPRLVFTSSELSTKKTRDFIGSAFGASVYDLYGCVEVERVAWECKEHSGHHIDIDSQVVEFIKDGENAAPGEPGKVIVTCLFNYATPLIRYDVGDIGVPSDENCQCGRGLPLMERIEGRENDYIRLPNGRFVSPMAFIIIDEISGVRQFRVTQSTNDQLKIELVLSKSGSHQTKQAVHKYVQEIVGKDVSITIEEKEGIIPERSGKVRIVKSFF